LDGSKLCYQNNQTMMSAECTALADSFGLAAAERSALRACSLFATAVYSNSCHLVNLQEMWGAERHSLAAEVGWAKPCRALNLLKQQRFFCTLVLLVIVLRHPPHRVTHHSNHILCCFKPYW
jgi:hypothetical protein